MSDERSDNSDPGSVGAAGDGVSEQLSQQDMLLDRGVDDLLDEGYTVPDRRPSSHASVESGETIAERMAEEEPEVGTAPESEVEDDYEVGRRRSGRLVDTENDGFADVEKDLVAADVGRDGSAASAEEAAVHLIDEAGAGDDTGGDSDRESGTDRYPDGRRPTDR